MQSRIKHCLIHTFGGQLSLLSVVMFLLLIAAMACAWGFQGRAMLPVVLLDAGICFVASLFALLSETSFSGRSPHFGMVLSMMLRTGVPLIAVMTLKFLGGRFTEPSVLYYLLVFYFGSLITHVVISYSALNDNQPSAASHRPTE